MTKLTPQQQLDLWLEQWKPAIMAAAIDCQFYGVGVTHIDAAGAVTHVPVEDLFDKPEDPL